jgi:hypothetical protein
MASSYDNDLRLNEMATGDGSGTWGTTTNTNLELIAEAFSYGTEVITTNADTHTTTIADGATDPGRSLYLKYTGTLDSACTITIAPNDISKVWIIENGTSGSQNIIISQGSGANITIPAGDTKVVYSDGAGAGAAFVDAFASLSVVDLKVQDDLTVTDDLIVNGDIDLEGNMDVNGSLETDALSLNGTTVTSTAAEINLLDGSSANTVVNSKAVIYGSSGEVAGTLSTAAQPNITSVGTLTGFTSTGIDDNATSTAITIDSSENVLVGQSSTTTPGVDNTTAGVSIRGQDGSFFSRILGSGDANNVVSINRSTEDGNILGFQKDGTSVGSIGTNGGRLSIGSGDVNLNFNASANSIYPISDTAGTLSDGIVDIGAATARLKDLYLSSGVVFGSTGGAVSSKTLDDYEEGTWTATLGATVTNPTITQGNTIDCRYTKIGNVCTVHGYSGLRDITAVGSGSPKILGLPFTATNYAQPVFAHGNMFADSVSGYVEVNQNFFFPIKNGSTANEDYTTGGKYIMFSMTYRVN